MLALEHIEFDEHLLHTGSAKCMAQKSFLASSARVSLSGVKSDTARQTRAFFVKLLLALRLVALQAHRARPTGVVNRRRHADRADRIRYRSGHLRIDRPQRSDDLICCTPPPSN